MRPAGRAPEPPLVEEARQAIADIVGALESARDGPALGLGDAGMAVALAYLREGDPAPADRVLERALTGLGGEPLGPGLMEGVAGIAWASAHLARLRGEELSDAHEEVDAALLAWVTSGGHGEFDLVSGLVGVGVYALERLPGPAGAELLDAVAGALAATAERTALGACWRRDRSGPVDLGMAHGCAGVVALLAAMPAEALLEEAVAFLLAHEGPPSSYGRFPCWVDGDAAAPARLGWCYGDLGIAAALLRAGDRGGVPEWRDHAFDLCRGAAARRGPETAVIDAGLCHGAAGAAHLFGRFAAVSGDALLQEASGFWLERALAMRRPGSGVGGYVAVRGERPMAVADPGYLTGAAGVALALDAAVTGRDPAWDRALLVSPLDTAGPSA